MIKVRIREFKNLVKDAMVSTYQAKSGFKVIFTALPNWKANSGENCTAGEVESEGNREDL